MQAFEPFNEFDFEYHELLKRILNEGIEKKDRTGTGTKSVFGHMCRFDLERGFPLITTKKIHLKSIIHELLWMISGSTNVRYLQENGVSIWDEWADKNGDLGPVYGSQWRRWQTFDARTDGAGWVSEPIDQLQNVVDTIRKNPWSRRIMLSAWNVAEVPIMNLPPCHFNAQFNVEPGFDEATGYMYPFKLHCLMSIRSWDVFLGGPFNIAQYALLTMMIAQITDLRAGKLTIASGDTHLYLNHLDQAREQLDREFRPMPKMKLNPARDKIDGWMYEDFTIEGYDPHPHIKGEVSV